MELPGVDRCLAGHGPLVALVCRGWNGVWNDGWNDGGMTGTPECALASRGRYLWAERHRCPWTRRRLAVELAKAAPPARLLEACPEPDLWGDQLVVAAARADRLETVRALLTTQPLQPGMLWGAGPRVARAFGVEPPPPLPTRVPDPEAAAAHVRAHGTRAVFTHTETIEGNRNRRVYATATEQPTLRLDVESLERLDSLYDCHVLMVGRFRADAPILQVGRIMDGLPHSPDPNGFLSLDNRGLAAVGVRLTGGCDSVQYDVVVGPDPPPAPAWPCDDNSRLPTRTSPLPLPAVETADGALDVRHVQTVQLARLMVDHPTLTLQSAVQRHLAAPAQTEFPGIVASILTPEADLVVLDPVRVPTVAGAAELNAPDVILDWAAADGDAVLLVNGVPTDLPAQTTPSDEVAIRTSAPSVTVVVGYMSPAVRRAIIGGRLLRSRWPRGTVLDADLPGERLRLARVVCRLLDRPHFLDSGTLLGAVRDGRPIPHDDDFDLAVLVRRTSELDALCLRLEAQLPPPYRARRVDTYCDKVEVYDPTRGAYPLGDPYGAADFHHVTVDVQGYLRTDDHATPLYRLWKFDAPRYPLATLLPVGSVELCGEPFPAPADPTAVLEAVYGSLSLSAQYSDETGQYF